MPFSLIFGLFFLLLSTIYMDMKSSNGDLTRSFNSHCLNYTWGLICKVWGLKNTEFTRSHNLRPKWQRVFPSSLCFWWCLVKKITLQLFIGGHSECYSLNNCFHNVTYAVAIGWLEKSIHQGSPKLILCALLNLRSLFGPIKCPW